MRCRMMRSIRFGRCRHPARPGSTFRTRLDSNWSPRRTSRRAPGPYGGLGEAKLAARLGAAGRAPRRRAPRLCRDRARSLGHASIVGEAQKLDDADAGRLRRRARWRPGSRTTVQLEAIMTHLSERHEIRQFSQPRWSQTRTPGFRKDIDITPMYTEHRWTNKVSLALGSGAADTGSTPTSTPEGFSRSSGPACSVSGSSGATSASSSIRGNSASAVLRFPGSRFCIRHTTSRFRPGSRSPAPPASTWSTTAWRSSSRSSSPARSRTRISSSPSAPATAAASWSGTGQIRCGSSRSRTAPTRAGSRRSRRLTGRGCATVLPCRPGPQCVHVGRAEGGRSRGSRLGAPGGREDAGYDRARGRRHRAAGSWRQCRLDGIRRRSSPVPPGRGRVALPGGVRRRHEDQAVGLARGGPAIRRLRGDAARDEPAGRTACACLRKERRRARRSRPAPPRRRHTHRQSLDGRAGARRPASRLAGEREEARGRAWAWSLRRPTADS